MRSYTLKYLAYLLFAAICILAAPLIATPVSNHQSSVSVASRPEPGETKTTIKSILARGEFQTSDEESWWEAYSERISRYLSLFMRKLFGRIDPYSMEPGAGNTAIILLAGLVCLAVCVLAVVRLRGIFTRRRRLAGGTGDMATSGSVSVSDLAKSAGVYASKSNFNEAFRLAYLALLMAMDGAGNIRYQKSKTNWEYVRALESAGCSTYSAELKDLSSRFDSTHYGARPCLREDYNACVATYKRVIEENSGKTP
ncbi:MAG: DUF4129 domain-containing protein [Armatimonadota bacterium]|nr:DUF4129 domain-containing protein [Armatimonadota bacterium]